MESLGVLWDMDGTLVDTAELHFEAWSRLTQDLGRPFTRADFTSTFGLRNPEIFHHLFGKHFNDEQIAELGERKEAHYRASARAEGVTLLPGARTLLEGLHAAGVRQAIGSSAPRANLELILQLTMVAPFLEALVSMEDTQRGKPDPQVFQIAAERLGIAPERCIVIEDAVAGVQAARAGGMHCIAVRFVAHHPVDKLRTAGADLIVESLEQVDVAAVLRLASS